MNPYLVFSAKIIKISEYLMFVYFNKPDFTCLTTFYKKMMGPV